jgi:hypothetical protein
MNFENRVSRILGAIALATLFSVNASAQTTPTIEPRIATSPNNGQTMVFTFDKPVNGGTAAVTLGTATVGTTTFSGNEMIVNLTGVTDLQCVRVVVSNVTGVDGSTGGTGTASIRYIAGDVNQSGQVTGGDKLSVNFAQSVNPVTASNYLRDVNASGLINGGDVLAVNFRQSVNSLPNCP